MQLVGLFELLPIQHIVIIGCLPNQILHVFHDPAVFLNSGLSFGCDLFLFHSRDGHQFLSIGGCHARIFTSIHTSFYPESGEFRADIRDNTIVDSAHKSLEVRQHLLRVEPLEPVLVKRHLNSFLEEELVHLAKVYTVDIVLIAVQLVNLVDAVSCRFLNGRESDQLLIEDFLLLRAEQFD